MSDRASDAGSGTGACGRASGWPTSGLRGLRRTLIVCTAPTERRESPDEQEDMGIAQRESYIAGDIDRAALREVEQAYASETDSFADYLTTRELSRISHIAPHRIQIALTHGIQRPMEGIKRGDRWFIRRSEALRWSGVVADWEIARWTRARERISKEQRDDAHREMRRYYTPPEPRILYTYDAPPEGTPVYTAEQAAEVLDTTKLAFSVMCSKGGALAHVPRYREKGSRIKVYEAAPILRYAKEHREGLGIHAARGRKLGPRQKKEGPTLSVVGKESA